MLCVLCVLGGPHCQARLDDYIVCYLSFLFAFIFVIFARVYVFACLPDGARSLTNFFTEWGSMSGGTYYMFDMYDMWHVGELTKLHAYGFQFMFSGTSVSKGKSSG